MDPTEVIDVLAEEVKPSNADDVANKNVSKKFASVRFYFKDKVIYRFDLWSTGEVEGDHKIIELKDIINNLNDILPDGSGRKLKNFFAIVGLIRYIFPKSKFPVDSNQNEESVIITLENNVSSYIQFAKIKGLRIEINPSKE